MSILLYGCTNWTLTKRQQKKLNGNYTKMLQPVLNKSSKQHATNLYLYGHFPLISQTIQAKRAGHCWESKDELIIDILPWTPTEEHTSVGRAAKIYIHQLCANIGYCLNDCPRAMSEREGWRERAKEIRAVGMG